MKWSKLRKRIEGFTCDALKDRVELHSTRYKRTHDGKGRGWITIDKTQIVDMSTARYQVDHFDIAYDIRSINNIFQDYSNPDWDFADPKWREAYTQSQDEARIILERRGIFSQYDFYHALEDYLNLSIAKILASDNAIIRSLGMVDRRLGKRRLMNIKLSKDELPFVKRLYELRCEVEGI